MNDLATRYIGPSGLDPIMNRIFNTLPKLGISVAGSRLLAVRGRKSGEWRTTMVNLLTVEGTRYLVAPRGHTQWVKNLRVTPVGELRLGRKAELFTARELPDADKLPILRAYLDRWGWEVGRFFEGLDKNSTDAELVAIAPGFPVFELS
ncbi:nitroreductase family deazaflavin-dependent oxidoreductase [Nocardia sp. NBC_01503]|uniref:nitroreductase family deazaflavin-dependent oxidoreductase n=1 Tax=Nocardia sp. NBC_01503 TaxID=2975997 RepID=UPI002E7B7E60|nr:nitroreductase family deazaflavin-dependent oxidoreductase [Nocardia sp. NBC_01503]WTL31588.1 nitroreductase family deazaflavin-dependent oxidoreductase [Nocardia sp. NBC_01503]